MSQFVLCVGRDGALGPYCADKKAFFVIQVFDNTICLLASFLNQVRERDYYMEFKPADGTCDAGASDRPLVGVSR